MTTVRWIVDAHEAPYPELFKFRFTNQVVTAYVNYLDNLYDLLRERFPLTGIETVHPMIFKNGRVKNGSVGRCKVVWQAGQPQMKLYYQSLELSAYLGVSEYKSIIKHLNRFEPFTRFGLDAMHWIMLHEYSHMLQRVRLDPHVYLPNGRRKQRTRPHTKFFANILNELDAAIPFGSHMAELDPHGHAREAFEPFDHVVKWKPELAGIGS